MMHASSILLLLRRKACVELSMLPSLVVFLVVVVALELELERRPRLQNALSVAAAVFELARRQRMLVELVVVAVPEAC